MLVDAKLKAKELLAENKEKDKAILEKAHQRADSIIAIAKSEDKLKHAEEVTVKEIERAHNNANKVKEKAEAEAEKIVAKAKVQAEKIVEDTNAKLAEAREYIAQRKEVHARLQDFYKAQRDFLSNRG